jgi:hypothetical protein
MTCARLLEYELVPVKALLLAGVLEVAIGKIHENWN